MDQSVAEATAGRLRQRDVGNRGRVSEPEKRRRRQMGRRSAVRAGQAGDHHVLFPRFGCPRHHIHTSDGDQPAPGTQTTVHLLVGQTDSERLAA